jgi:hypothetical protein
MLAPLKRIPLMQWLRSFFSSLFKPSSETAKKEGVDWNNMPYPKPSDAGDDFRKRNEV